MESQQRSTHGDHSSSQKPHKDITDERVEEIKLEHYNRKLANQSHADKKGTKTNSQMMGTSQSDSKQNNRFNATTNSYNQ